MFLYGAVQSNAIQSIALSSQTFDNIIAEIAGGSCGVSASTASWICSAISDTDPSPFGKNIMVFTLGFLAVVILSIPLAILDLDNNMSVQVGLSIPYT